VREPEITEEEARILEDLAQMHTEDPEGFAALIGDLGTDEPQEDPALRHAEQLLEIFDARASERDRELGELLNRAFQQQQQQQRASEAESQP
jgi:hypothetical protein